MFVTQPKTYNNVSLLHKNHFDLLCRSNGYSREEYDICEKEDKLGFNHYTVEVWSQRCDNMMQRVFNEDNGFKNDTCVQKEELDSYEPNTYWFYNGE